MSEQIFISEFFNSLMTSETNNRFSFSDYFQNTYSGTYDFSSILPCLLSHSDISVTAPFYYEAANLNAFCLLHTTGGAGKLFYYDTGKNAAAYELRKDSLAFIDCRRHYKLSCLRSWEYTICFVTSPISCYYYQKLESLGGCIFHLNTASDVFTLWENLLKIKEDDEVHTLMRSGKLIALYTALYLSHTVSLYHVPSYIADMKKNFDTACHEQYSLDALAAKYHINKFRLCREFAKYYEDTPIQYLNKVRIEKAKDLLLHSDEKINVIGQIVGIENTNHFIRLFKEKTGVTPLTYRRETPIP
ncbi:MAG: helix-turn-helix transcriptional regulator [Clostridium sp.]|nr:helix-turn-helix transcriptional regulator [Clostridium sp.]